MAPQYFDEGQQQSGDFFLRERDSWGYGRPCRRSDSGYRRRGGDRSYAGSRELLIYSYRMIQTLSDLKTVRFNEQADGVIILDQTLLPGKGSVSDPYHCRGDMGCHL